MLITRIDNHRNSIMCIIILCPTVFILNHMNSFDCPSYAFFVLTFFSIINRFAIVLHVDCFPDLNNFVVYQDFSLSDFNNSLMGLNEFLSVSS